METVMTIPEKEVEYENKGIQTSFKNEVPHTKPSIVCFDAEMQTSDKKGLTERES